MQTRHHTGLTLHRPLSPSSTPPSASFPGKAFFVCLFFPRPARPPPRKVNGPSGMSLATGEPDFSFHHPRRRGGALARISKSARDQRAAGCFAENPSTVITFKLGAASSWALLSSADYSRFSTPRCLRVLTRNTGNARRDDLLINLSVSNLVRCEIFFFDG